MGHVAWAPLPGRPEYVHQQAFREAWGHIHQQAAARDVAEGQRFEVIADRFERPTLDQLTGLRFEAVPEITDEVEETATWSASLPSTRPFCSLCGRL